MKVGGHYFLSKFFGNHCVPNCETFQVPADSHPYHACVSFCISSLKAVATHPYEVSSFNLLERDCQKPNIMMNADPTYPNGFHAAYVLRLAPACKILVSQRFPRYHLTDFVVSARFQSSGTVEAEKDDVNVDFPPS